MSKADGGSCRLRWVGLLLAMSVAVGVLVPAFAQGAGSRFMVDYCDPALPGGNPPAIYFHSEKAYAPFQTCASPGGAVGVTQTGTVTEGPAWIETGIPGTPLGYVESAVITGFAVNIQPGAGNSYIAENGWPPLTGSETPRYFFVRDEEPPQCTLISLCGENPGTGWAFDVALTCSGTCAAGGVIGAHYLVATEVDTRAPKVLKAEGSLLAGGVLRGHQTMSGEASDIGGGISRIEVLVNGIAAATTPGGCALTSVANRSYEGVVATSVKPCPERLPGSWVLNTAAPPFHEGANTVQVCASDLATLGNPNTTCSTPATVAVNNTCTESAVSGGEDLSVNFAKTNSEAVTVGFGEAAEVKGQLANNAGDPVPGATICVQALTEGAPGEPSPIATATTDASGQFTYDVPPGPNRRVLIGYRHDSFQVGRTINYAAHSQPSLTLQPGRIHEGDKIEITGLVPEPSAAARVVILQASALHGHRWLTFRKATTGPRGGFRASYRFGSTTHTITYKIRAVVPLQSGYPYAAGHSKPARVKVEAGARHHRAHKRAPKS